MPRSYRHVILAALGWLILGATPAPNKGPQAKEAEPSQRVERALESIANSQAATVEQSEAGEYEAPCEEGEYNNKSDLCAQWYAARAAGDAANWAWWSLWVGIAGTLGVVATLHYTRKAVLAAEAATADADRAILIAERNAEAAVEQVRVARDTAARQLRPYLYLTGIRPKYQHLRMVEHVRDVVTFEVTVQNYGQTPAKNARIKAKGFVGGSPNEDFTKDLGEVETQPLGDIPIGYQKSVSGYSASGLQKADDAISEKAASVFFEGVLSYYDGFGKEYYTTFRLFSSGEDYSHERFQVARVRTR